MAASPEGEAAIVLQVGSLSLPRTQRVAGGAGRDRPTRPDPPACRLSAMGAVPMTFVVRPEGAHTWGLFESEMQESWNTVIGPALGA